MNRHLKTLALSLSAVCLAVATCADTSVRAVATVFCTVKPTVAISTITPEVNAGEVTVGEFGTRFSFKVASNTDSVKVFAEATPLYLAGDQSSAVEPIPLSDQAVIEHSSGSEAVMFGPDGEQLDGLASRSTNAVMLSGSSGQVDGVVTVSVQWDQSDPDRPVGVYSGKVALTALALP